MRRDYVPSHVTILMTFSAFLEVPIAAWEIWHPALNGGSGPGVSMSVSVKSAMVSIKTKGWQLLQTVVVWRKEAEGWEGRREMSECFPGAYTWKKLLATFTGVSGFLFPGQAPPGPFRGC